MWISLNPYREKENMLIKNTLLLITKGKKRRLSIVFAEFLYYF
jgi:hypothetical protein